MTDYTHIDSADHWDGEYRQQGIPSSWKDDPSTVVQWTLSNLPYLGGRLTNDDYVLDVGCGSGRNSLAVATRTPARVVGFDYSQEAVDKATKRLASADSQLQSRVRFEQRDMRDPLPVEDSSTALILDVFVYFHLLRAEDRARYRSEAHRVLKSDGHLLVSLATDEDGYYNSCPNADDWGAKSPIPIVLDPAAGVGNIMHNLGSLEQELSDQFRLTMAWRKTARGPMHGKTYDRVTLATLWTPLATQ